MLRYLDDITEMRNNMREKNRMMKNYTEDNYQPEKRVLNGNMHQLNQHKWKQQYINYKRDLKKFPDGQKKITYEVVESNDDLMDIISKNEFKVKWGKLDAYLRKKKIDEYVNTLLEQNKIDTKDSIKLKRDLKVLVGHGKLKKSSEVDYDIENTCIKSIKCLKIKDKKYQLS